MILMDVVKKIEKNENRRAIIPVSIFPAITFTNSTFKDNYTNSNIQFNTLKWALNNFDIDGTRAITDLVVEVEAMGVPIQYPKGDTPYVKETIIKDEKDIHKLHKVNPYKDGRLPIILDIIRKTTAYLKEKNMKKYICGSMTGPFTCLGHLIGPSESCVKTIKDPVLLHKLLRFITDSLKEYAKALVEAGADVIWISEPLGCVLSPEQYLEFSSSYCREIFQSVDSMTILHVCGNTYPLVENMVKSGAQGLSFDEKVGLYNILHKIPDDVVILGDVPPVKTLLQGTAYEVAHYCNNVLNTMLCNHNFILSTGCSIPPKTSMENIKAFTDSVKKVKAYSEDITKALRDLKNSILQKQESCVSKNLNLVLNKKVSAEDILKGCLIPAIDYAIILYKKGEMPLSELILVLKYVHYCIQDIKDNLHEDLLNNTKMNNQKIVDLLVGQREFAAHSIFDLLI